MSGYAFLADSIGKSFGGRTILSAASIWATAGRITALFGRNGCGKSTLLRIGAGLVAADHGAVHFAGRVHLRPKLRTLAGDGLFYLPERDLLSRRLTFGQQLAAITWRFDRPDPSGILHRLGVANLVEKVPAAMSGGERRRAEVAAAVHRAPRCLLADEPFAGVAPRDAAIIADEFASMAGSGCAVVITGHEVPDLLRIADEVVWLTAGTTHGLGPPERAVRNDQFGREYLGSTLRSMRTAESDRGPD